MSRARATIDTAGEPRATERNMLRFAGVVLPAAVWLLCLITPPRGGITPGYALALTALIGGLIAVDQTLPSTTAPAWRRGAWLAAELALGFGLVQLHGSLVRPALIYLIPASRALLLFEGRVGLGLSLLTWLAYGVNVGLYALPDRPGEFSSYFAYFLAPYVLAIVLTSATLGQIALRRRVETVYGELSVAHAELQRLHDQVRETAVTEERNRLAREIHDSVAHYLTIVNVQLEAAEKLADEQPERAIEQVRRARRLALECLREARRSVAALRSTTLEELSLPRALGKLSSEFAESTGIAVELAISVDDEARFPPDTSLALFRGAQEGLTNVHRHARASRVRLELSRENGSVRLVVEDDGIGPSASPAPVVAGELVGFGLLGLRERVKLLGGDLAFEPAQPTGTRLAITLPFGGRL